MQANKQGSKTAKASTRTSDTHINQRHGVMGEVLQQQHRAFAHNYLCSTVPAQLTGVGAGVGLCKDHLVSYMSTFQHSSYIQTTLLNSKKDICCALRSI